MNHEAAPPPAPGPDQPSPRLDGLKPPVNPVDVTSDVQEGVLFSDPTLTAWWWNTHEMITNKQRQELARAVYPLCTSAACKNMMYSILSELDSFYAPTTAMDSFMMHGRKFCQERPAFAILAALGVAGLCIQAGMSIWNLFAH